MRALALRASLGSKNIAAVGGKVQTAIARRLCWLDRGSHPLPPVHVAECVSLSVPRWQKHSSRRGKSAGGNRPTLPPTRSHRKCVLSSRGPWKRPPEDGRPRSVGINKCARRLLTLATPRKRCSLNHEWASSRLQREPNSEVPRGLLGSKHAMSPSASGRRERSSVGNSLSGASSGMEFSGNFLLSNGQMKTYVLASQQQDTRKCPGKVRACLWANKCFVNKAADLRRKGLVEGVCCPAGRIFPASQKCEAKPRCL